MRDLKEIRFKLVDSIGKQKMGKTQDIKLEELHHFKDWGIRHEIQQHELQNITVRCNRETLILVMN